MKGQSRARVWVRRVILCLVMGAVVNVMVAWGVAQWHWEGRSKGNSAPDDPPATSWPAGAPAGAPAECYLRVRTVRFGKTILSYTVAEFDPAQPKENAVSRRFGMPFRSLEWTAFFQFSGQQRSYRWGDLRAVPWVHKSRALRWLQYGLPIQPRPWGFAANSLIYGSGVYLAGMCVGAMRRRLRLKRSKCPKCGYDVTGVERCPECGEGVALGERGDRGEKVVKVE